MKTLLFDSPAIKCAGGHQCGFLKSPRRSVEGYCRRVAKARGRYRRGPGDRGMTGYRYREPQVGTSGGESPQYPTTEQISCIPGKQKNKKKDREISFSGFKSARLFTGINLSFKIDFKVLFLNFYFSPFFSLCSLSSPCLLLRLLLCKSGL